MDNEIEIVSDGDGLAVVGEPGAVERFLRDRGLWAASKALDTPRLDSVLRFGSDVAQTASDIAASSVRWIRLTEESAVLVDEHGLMDSKTPGVSHVMIGVPGEIQSWLQSENGPSSVLSNPAVLSGIAGLMSQASKQQAVAQVLDYLVRIDEKADDILAKVDATVLKDMRGARFQIRRAQTMRQAEGRVSADSWDELQSASGKIGDVQGYALEELKRVADKLDAKTSIKALADAVEEARPQVQKWLAVLADCFQLQDTFDVLALDRVLDEPAEVLNNRRVGLEADRQDRRSLIFEETAYLLDRMDSAVGRANARLLWTRKSSLSVIDSGNRVGDRVHEFHTVIGVDAEPRSWEPAALGAVVEVGSHAVQKTKDATPYVATGLTALGTKVAWSKMRGGA